MDSYIISKAALNMLTLRYAKQYADAGFTIAAISPGVRIAKHPCKDSFMLTCITVDQNGYGY
jgi:NAD(P)-dependent dehydrogenase (short-subunit alcohol dehydrogenase family)